MNNENENGDYNSQDDNTLRERLPIRRTNWRWRQYSLSPLDIIFIDDLTDKLMDLLAFATKLISLYTILTTLDGNGLDFINAIDNIQDQIYNILYVILPDIYSLSNDIDFVRYMHVEPLSHFPPHQNRLLNNISDEFARFYTRFTKLELTTLFNHLQIPLRFENNTRHQLPGETVFLISLVYMAHAFPLYSMTHIFGGNP